MISNPLFFIGVVENYDPTNEGRVQVRAFDLHGSNDKVPTKSLPWAKCASGSYDPNTQLPPLNSLVYGMFLDGRDAQQPLILGLIPTNFDTRIDHPESHGWGVYPEKDGEELAKGSRPSDVHQPAQSRLVRGEDLSETYILSQEMNRVEEIKIAGSEDTWDEPPPAYAAKYPHNKIWETSKHVIELDDTPDHERIMIYHKEGAYIQMDSYGNVAYKADGDKFDVSVKNSHVFIGGQSHIHVNSDATMYVKGNYTQEVTGDYNLIVHGNAQFGTGQQLAINGGTQLTMRGPEVRMEANVSNMSIIAKGNMKQQAGESWNAVAPFTRQTSLISHSTQAGPKGYNLFVAGDYTASVNNMDVDALGTQNSLLGSRGITLNSLAGPAQLNSTVYTSIYGPIVTIDNVVSLAGQIRGPTFALSAATNLLSGLDYAEAGAFPQMPEPPAASTAFVQRQGSSSSAGVTSGAGHSDRPESTLGDKPADIVRNKSDTMKPILDMISAAESRADGYDAVYSEISQRNRPTKPISRMTVGEVLDWQDKLIASGEIGSESYHDSPSVAAGRYQFINATLERVVANGYISRDEVFGPEVQDRAAIGLMEMDGNLNTWLDGKLSNTQFQRKLAGIWAGIPDPSTGESVYGSDGFNQATITSNTAGVAVESAKNRYVAYVNRIVELDDSVDLHIAANIPNVFIGDV